MRETFASMRYNTGMDDEGVKVVIFFLFLFGAGVGFYLAKLFL